MNSLHNSVIGDLTLTKYKDPETLDSLYFWTERRGSINVHVSPMFNTVELANKWLDMIAEQSKQIFKGMTEK